MAGVELLNRTGELWANSNHKRNEMHRLSDIFGLESLVDEMAHKTMAESDEVPTSSAILGPFWSPNAPERELGASIIDSPAPGGLVTLCHGKVIDAVSGEGIAGALVDVWQASTNGKYDFQDPDNQVDNNLRGKFRCDKNGEYHFYCLRPTAYSLPTDGPAGVILNLLDRHPMRPAHIHVMVRRSEEGWQIAILTGYRSLAKASSHARPKYTQTMTHISRRTLSLLSRMISWSTSRSWRAMRRRPGSLC
jgi:catechol 1,2-dioxygenase